MLNKNKPMFGNNVSKSKRRTRRTFKRNMINSNTSVSERRTQRKSM